MNDSSKHLNEINSGNRFEFGKNWQGYLDNIDTINLDNATKSLKEMFQIDNMHEKTFLDVGSGSAIFSLAARGLGAKVVSMDYDPNSVDCAKRLKEKYYKDDDFWKIIEGSAIDKVFMKSLGEYDYVYSWGVLHHTGQMWNALDYIDTNVKKNGKLFISLYNDQNRMSKFWMLIKKMYVSLPKFLRFIIVIPSLIFLWAPATIRDFVVLKPFKTWKNYHSNRGMSAYRDLIDWVGGYPFEVAAPDEVFLFYKRKNYILENLITVSGGHGCNEYVFKKEANKK